VKIALGTAQFGMDYGVANGRGQVAAGEIATILQRATSLGIDTLDTAIAYGDSEARLGDAGVTGWRVISKLPALPADMPDPEEWALKQARGSLARLRLNRLDALLLHRSADLTGPNGPVYVKALQRLKSAGLVRALGVSIYDPAELDAIWLLWRPEIVQAPLNVLDRRLIQSGWLRRLTEAGIEVHVRSAFLQGLLLMPDANRPAMFARWAPVLDRWLEWCRHSAVAPLQAALRFVGAQRGVERIVVGVDSTQQLEEICGAAGARCPVPPEELASDDLDLIEPRRWQRQ